MKISIEDLSFGFGSKKIFKNLNLEITADPEGLPLIILGPSGCGKTSFLRLIAGLVKPEEGKITFTESREPAEMRPHELPMVSCVFQEYRLLPHLSILRNVSLPLEKIFGKDEARCRAINYLKAVLLDERSAALPAELSGGQKQRASLARAFAYPSGVLLMDEPFQSMDIPLRLSLMELTLSLLSGEKRLCIAVTHEPREAIFMGSRVIVLGPSPEGVVLDEKLGLSLEERAYGSSASGDLEKRLIRALGKCY